MSADIFVDTNVLVYAYDRSEPIKQAIAVTVLASIVRSGAGVISAQVLSEFFNAVTRKILAPLTLEEAHARVQNLLRLLHVVPVTDLIVLEAVRGVREHQLSLWDAQIWAAARLNQIPVILSEDFRGDLVLEGIRVVDPFRPDFKLEEWI